MSARARLALALASTVLVGYVVVGSLLGRVLGDTSYGQLAIFNEVVRMVLDSYVEPVDVSRAMAGARQGMVDTLDGESAYLDAESFRLLEQPVRETEAEPGLVVTRRFGYVMVVTARPGTPAQRAGLRPGDILKTIDEKQTRQMPAIVAERQLRGSPGSSVRLGILRAGADPFETTVVRERLQPVAPESRVLDGAVGYVKVPEFRKGTGDDVRQQLERLKRAGAKAIVLDLREAGFGTPRDGVTVAELFMQGGTVAKLVGRHAEDEVLTASAAHSTWTGPLAVLIDNGTAGPGEVVAAALADAGRAQLVGERTFGRAALTRAVPLPTGGMVLTVARYVSPKGTAIHSPEGIKPTVAVEGRPDSDQDLPPDAPRPDHILERALEVLEESQKTAA